jgi:hypothetical protein
MDLGFEDNIFKKIDTSVKPAITPAPKFDPHFPVAPTEVASPEIKPYDPNSVYEGKHFGQPASGDGK